MKKILLGLGALVLTLSFVGEASAAPGRGDHGRSGYAGRGYGRSSYGRSAYGRSSFGRTYFGRPYPGRASFGRTPYHLRNGVRFRGGYYYRGRSHSHWSHRVWSPAFRRYHYFDPYLEVYYYYCPITLRYLPVPVVLR